MRPAGHSSSARERQLEDVHREQATVCIAAHRRGAPARQHPQRDRDLADADGHQHARAGRPAQARHRLDDRQVARRAAQQLVEEAVDEPDGRNATGTDVQLMPLSL